MRMKILQILRNLRSQSLLLKVFLTLHLPLRLDIATDIEEVQVENYGNEPIGVGGDDAIDTKAIEHEEQHDQPTTVDGDDAIDTRVLSRGSSLFHQRWKNLRLLGLPGSVVH